MALKYNAQAKRDQEMLRNLGYYRGRIDGLWGSKSIKAMARYHANNRSDVPVKGKKIILPDTMSLLKHQLAFTKDQMELDKYWFAQGYGYTDGDAWSKSEYRNKYGKRAHKINSQHFKRLARDKLLFDKDGRYMTKTSDHYRFGMYWESLSPYNRSGCRYNDGNHYERMTFLWGNPHYDKNSHYTIEF